MKEIILTRGYKALVDDEDFDRINSFNWFATVNGLYVRASRMQMRRMIYIQHQVLGIMPWELNGKEIDHNDRNPLNNQRYNLVITTHTGNMRNTRRHIERKGYCFNHRAQLWSVYLDSPGLNRKYLGYTKTKEEAIQRIEEARSENH
jgi:hypothetical protein